jgi:hypothetical protein
LRHGGPFGVEGTLLIATSQLVNYLTRIRRSLPHTKPPPGGAFSEFETQGQVAGSDGKDRESATEDINLPHSAVVRVPQKVCGLRVAITKVGMSDAAHVEDVAASKCRLNFSGKGYWDERSALRWHRHCCLLDATQNDITSTHPLTEVRE